MTLREQLSESILAIPGVEGRKSRFSDEAAFYLGGREIAHFHSAHVIDIRLTRPSIRELAPGDARLSPRGSSDWVEFTFRRTSDLEGAVGVVRAAVVANGG